MKSPTAVAAPSNSRFPLRSIHVAEFSLLAFLALVTLVAKGILEWAYGRQLGVARV